MPNYYAVVVLALYLSIIIALRVSRMSTIHRMGLEQFSTDIWLSVWGLFWLIIFPVLLLVLPIIRKISFLFV
ncbi:DUF2798 domain-containing protein [Acinetobacter sp. IK40]|uniref:DUF2798 domain-containing protein n=1 Tax=Acinetobacter sp. IK40 TaxID=2928897 RepID=UPI002D1E6493|nr:DUF2798 domain-containing protein [Acinetobacter sp. IK40]MEB3791886.1 DUF2798 domain-containing protein [Acinetobacter sp. IK40]